MFRINAPPSFSKADVSCASSIWQISSQLHNLKQDIFVILNPLNSELNPICYLLALLGAHHFLHVSRIRIKLLSFRLLMSYIYGAPILDVSRSHTTTQHSREDSSGRVISSPQRPLPDNTRHSQQTNIHAPGGIRTHDLSRRAAADLRLRPRGQWDRHLISIQNKLTNNIKMLEIFFVEPKNESYTAPNRSGQNSELHE